MSSVGTSESPSQPPPPDDGPTQLLPVFPAGLVDPATGPHPMAPPHPMATTHLAASPQLMAPPQAAAPSSVIVAWRAIAHRWLATVRRWLATAHSEYRQLSQRQRTAAAAIGGVVVLALVAALGLVLLGGGTDDARSSIRANQVLTTSAPEPTPSETTPAPGPADASLPVVTYAPAPAGFPADPQPMSTELLAEGAHPTTKIPVYDGFGGQAKAFLAPTISGVPITMPIVERRAGWIAVLLPSANRTIGWLGPQGWDLVSLRDHLVVRRGTHEMSWYRDGALQRTWPVTLGIAKTPTPLGRTFVLGRSTLPGYVYGGVDVMALGSIPDNVDALPPGLRGAHIGIHTWHNDASLGKDDTDGCIRLTKSGQQLLLTEIIPGSTVVVVD